MYGAERSLSPKKHLLNGETTKGERNCPKYKLADNKGITVVADSFPPFIEAMVLRYGTPTPFAIPMNMEPTISVIVEIEKESVRHPRRKNNGAKYFNPRRNAFIHLPKNSPTKKATTSSPTIMNVIAFADNDIPCVAVIAKFVG